MHTHTIFVHSRSPWSRVRRLATFVVSQDEGLEPPRVRRARRGIRLSDARSDSREHVVHEGAPREERRADHRARLTARRPAHRASAPAPTAARASTCRRALAIGGGRRIEVDAAPGPGTRIANCSPRAIERNDRQKAIFCMFVRPKTHSHREALGEVQSEKYPESRLFVLFHLKL